MKNNESIHESKDETGITYQFTDKREPFQKIEAQRQLRIHAKHLDEIKNKEGSKIFKQFKRKGESQNISRQLHDYK